jgi:aspartate-semialdehyde dehydrogenase
MKVAIIGLSGNVGKTTVAKQLLAPRLKAPEFAMETINASASDAGETERVKSEEFGALQEELMQLDSAIVDIGAYNVEEFMKLMGQFAASHEEFDYYVVPTVANQRRRTWTTCTRRCSSE